MHDVGYQPSFVLWDIQFYDPKSVQAAKTVSFPPSYVGLAALPAELVDDYPVLQQIRSIMNAGLAKPKFTSFTGLGFSAWTLWAKSATDCGDDLTAAMHPRQGRLAHRLGRGRPLPAELDDPRQADPVGLRDHRSPDATGVRLRQEGHPAQPRALQLRPAQPGERQRQLGRAHDAARRRAAGARPCDRSCRRSVSGTAGTIRIARGYLCRPDALTRVVDQFRSRSRSRPD